MPKSPTRPTQYPSPRWARALHRGKPRHSCRGGRPKSQFSKMLKGHRDVAVSTLESLSKQQAKQLSKALGHLKALPWKIAIIVDSTLQHRASLHPENAKTFNHGKGYVIGHQWTNIVLIIKLSMTSWWITSAIST